MVQKQKYYDSALLFLAMCAFAYCFFFLYIKPQTYNLSDPSLQVATLEKPTRVVKFKNKDQFSWRDGHGGQPLEAGDRIYTHESSEARVNFLQGPKLILEPNTLLEISDNLALDIKSGNILALLESKSDHITLLLGKRKFKLTGVGARIRIQKGTSQAQIKVLGGQVSVKEEDGIQSAMKIGPGQFNLSESTSLQNTVLSRGLSLISPDPFIERQYLPNEKVKFQFAGQENQTLSKDIKKVLFAKDPSFSEIIYEDQLDKGGNVTLKPITEGMLYIKTLPDESIEKLPIQTFSLFIKRLKPPIIQGRYGDDFYQGHLDKNPVLIEGDSYQMEHSIYEENSSAFSMNLKVVADEVFLPMELKSGLYFLKTRIFLDQDKGDESYLKKIRIQDAPNLIAPTTTFPADGYTLYTYKDAEEVTLEWMDIQPNTGFTVSLQGALQDQIDSSENKVSLKLIAEGQYSWGVKSNFDYLSSPWSKRKNFILKKLETLEKFPQTGAIIELDKPNQLVTFEWNKEKLNQKDSYLLEISKSDNFKELIKKVKTIENKEKVFFKSTGSFFWRTRIIDKEGRVRLGTPKRIIVRPAPPPPPIKLKNKVEKNIQYKSDVSVPFFKRNFLITILNIFISNAHAEEAFTILNWPKEELAKAYILKIYSDPKREKLILETRIDEAKYEFRNPMAGEYYWEVAIVDYWDRVGEFSNLSQLILKEKSLEIEMTSPRHNHKLKKLNTRLRFKTNRPIKNFTLLLSKELNFKRPFHTKVFQTKPKVSHSININLNSIKDLPKTFYWRILVKEKEKTSLSLRRKIIMSLKEDLENNKMKQGDVNRLAKKVEPTPSFNIFQEYGQSSFDQSSPTFSAKTSGIFVTSIGIEIRAKKLLSQKTLFQTKIGRGKTFGDLAYYQGSVAMGYLVTNFWNFNLYIGPRALFQTSFLEQNSSSLTAKNNFLPQIEAILRKSFFFLSERDYLQLRVGGGKGLSYELYFKSPVYQFSKKRTLFLGPYYQSLSFDEGTREIDRQSLGLNLTLSL